MIYEYFAWISYLGILFVIFMQIQGERYRKLGPKKFSNFSFLKKVSKKQEFCAE